MGHHIQISNQHLCLSIGNGCSMCMASWDCNHFADRFWEVGFLSFINFKCLGTWSAVRAVTGCLPCTKLKGLPKNERWSLKFNACPVMKDWNFIGCQECLMIFHCFDCLILYCFDCFDCLILHCFDVDDVWLFDHMNALRRFCCLTNFHQLDHDLESRSIVRLTCWVGIQLCACFRLWWKRSPEMAGACKYSTLSKRTKQYTGPCTRCGRMTCSWCDGVEDLVDEDEARRHHPSKYKCKAPRAFLGVCIQTPHCNACDQKHGCCPYCKGLQWCAPQPHQWHSANASLWFGEACWYGILDCLRSSSSILLHWFP